MKEIKRNLYARCQSWVDEKISLAQSVIKAAQASANEETKSSAGDKYETARAMAQLEIEKGSSQLEEANKLKRILNRFSPETHGTQVMLGSLVETDSGWFYMSISAGKVTINDNTFICLSPASPLGAMMMGLSPGNTFCFNQQDYYIKGVD